MTWALWLLMIQGILGAFDTLYYHEWRVRLVAYSPLTSPELRLHAARDGIYALIMSTLPWLAWQGGWALVLAVLLVAEIILTLTDFVVEDAVRRTLGGVYPGERVMHAVMGLVYGAMLAYLLPVVVAWWAAPTALSASSPAVPEPLRWLLLAMAVGVLLSGLRDFYATCGMPYGAWPWGYAALRPQETRT
jgi:hypothetical protein